MYNFKDTIDKTQDFSSFPSAALNFNGAFVEDEISGYKTLTVEGRETISVELETESTQTGGITTNAKLPTRELIVRYILQENDNYLLQKKFKELRKMLHASAAAPLFFADEPDANYFGRLKKMDTVPGDTNHVIGSFTILCDDPYKYGDLMQTSGIVGIETFYSTPPELIELTLSAAAQVVNITNGTQTIGLTGNFSAADKFAIDVKNGTITRNNVDAAYTINLNSDFENFEIKQWQTVSSPQGSLILSMRERWL